MGRQPVELKALLVGESFRTFVTGQGQPYLHSQHGQQHQESKKTAAKGGGGLGRCNDAIK